MTTGEINVHESVRDGYGSRCRDPYTGVWIPTSDCSWHHEEISSKFTFALGPNGVTRYEFEYRIVEAAKLIASHDPFTFEPNPAFPQVLQPRLRGRAANRVQVETMAANLDPDSLLTDFRSLDRGAPIVGPDMAVESGNGRVMAIIRASREHPAVYERYRLALYESAVDYDLSVGQAERMTAPVLVRIRQTETDRVAFVQEANAPSTLTASSIEQARTDAARVTLSMLMGITVGDTESLEDALRATRNAPFVTQFLAKLPPNEQARLVDGTGRLNQDGVRRAVAAVFVRAFPGDAGLALAERVFETLDNDIRNVVGGIGRSLGPLAQLSALIAEGKRPPDLDIAGDLAATVPVFVRIKRTAGQTVRDYLDQAQLFGRELSPFQEAMLRFIDENSRSGKRISAALRNYAAAVIALPPPEQVSFMPAEPPDKLALWEAAVSKPEEAPTPTMFQDQDADAFADRVLAEFGQDGRAIQHRDVPKADGWEIYLTLREAELFLEEKIMADVAAGRRTPADAAVELEEIAVEYKAAVRALVESTRHKASAHQDRRGVADTIWAQIPTGVKMRLGAHTVSYDRKLTFQVRKGRRPHIYGFEITLNPRDYYDVLYWHVNMSGDLSVETMGEAHDVDAENLGATLLRLFEGGNAAQHQDGDACVALPTQLAEPEPVGAGPERQAALFQGRAEAVAEEKRLGEIARMVRDRTERAVAAGTMSRDQAQIEQTAANSALGAAVIRVLSFPDPVKSKPRRRKSTAPWPALAELLEANENLEVLESDLPDRLHELLTDGEAPEEVQYALDAYKEALDRAFKRTGGRDDNSERLMAKLIKEVKAVAYGPTATAHQHERPDLKPGEVYVPDVCGSQWWGMLHAWAKVIHDEGCPTCGGFAIKAARALHDVVNVKLGKPVKYGANLREIAAIYQAAAAGGAGAVAAQDDSVDVDEIAELLAQSLGEVGARQ